MWNFAIYMGIQHVAMHTSDPVGAYTAHTRGLYADMCIHKKKVGPASHHVSELCVTQTEFDIFHRQRTARKKDQGRKPTQLHTAAILDDLLDRWMII